MQYFNLYQGSLRINKHPLTKDELDSITKNSKVIRKMDANGNTTEIPLSKVRVAKCTII